MFKYLNFVFFIFIFSAYSFASEIQDEIIPSSSFLSNVDTCENQSASEIFELITAPFLFELERDSEKSLLLGSCHWVKIERFPRYALQTILSAQTLILESIENFKDMSKDQLMKYGFLCTPNSNDWIEQLDPHLRTHLEEKLNPTIKCYHPDIEIRDLTPLIAMLKYASPDNNEGMDSQLQEIYDPSRVFALECPIEVFKLMEEEFTISSFKDILENDYIAKQNGEEEPTDYTQRWLDYHYIHGLYNEGLKDFLNISSQESSAIRNYKWIPQIENYHKQKPSPVLFVVGMAHLLGEDGLLNLLQEKKGFTIRQITPDGSFQPIDMSKFK